MTKDEERIDRRLRELLAKGYDEDTAWRVIYGEEEQRQEEQAYLRKEGLL